MSERQLQFRVGIFVLLSMGICLLLVIQFGDLHRYWEETYQIGIHFETAPGMQRGTPVRQNGISIGTVSDVLLDDVDGGVLVVVDIESDRQLRRDSRPTLVRTILGDSSIEFSAGASLENLPPNSKVEGVAPTDPMEIVRRLEVSVSETLNSFAATSEEWQQVGHNLNMLVETRQGNLDEVIERAANSLATFTRTMETADTTLTEANHILADPELQQNLRDTVAALPLMARETRETIAAARTSIEQINANLDNLHEATDPLAEHSRSIIVKLDNSLGQLESLMTELNAFAVMVNSEDGSLQRFAADPDLYENLNESAAAMTSLVESLDPIVRDVRIFSDRIARHPELLGVSGAVRGSTGIKDDETAAPPGRQILQTGGMQ